MNSLDSQGLGKAASPSDETKTVIVQTALRMFAERGIEGVSLSELRAASGQNNRSAIHYHFGNKDGLLDAVTLRLAARMEPLMQDSVQEGRGLMERGELTRERFIRIMAKPFVTLYHKGTEGMDCLRMLSHLSHEQNDRQQARAFAPLQKYMGEMAVLLQSIMPTHTPNQLAPLLFMSGCSLIEILICSHMLTREHTLAGDQVTAPGLDAFVELVLSFVTGGLTAASDSSALSPG